jgi:O-antigen ligase
MAEGTAEARGAGRLRRHHPPARRITPRFLLAMVALAAVVAAATIAGLPPVVLVLVGAAALVAPFVGRTLRWLGATSQAEQVALAALWAAMLSTLVLRIRGADDITADPFDAAGLFRMAMLALAFALGIAVLVLRPRRAVPRPPLSCSLYAAYVVAAGLSVLMATHPGFAGFRVFELATFVLVFYAVYVAFDRQVEVAVTNLMRFVYLLLASTLVSLAMDPLHAWQEQYETDRLKGVHPYLSSNVVGLLGTLCVAYGLGRRRIRWLPAIAGAVFIGLAQHRTGYLAVVAIVVVRLLFARRSTATVVALVLVGATVAVAAGGLVDSIWTRGQKEAEVSTLSSRTEWWSAGLDALGRSPFNGLGLSSGTRYEVFASLESRRTINTPNLHSTWMEALVGAGILGASLLVAAFLVALVMAVRCASRYRYLLPLLFLVGLLVNSLTSSTFELGGLATLVLLFAGAEALYPPPAPAEATSRPPGSSIEWTTGPLHAVGRGR